MSAHHQKADPNQSSLYFSLPASVTYKNQWNFSDLLLQQNKT